MRIGRQLIGWFLFIGLVLVAIWLLNNQKTRKTYIAESQVLENLDKIQSVEIRSDEISGTFSRPVTIGTHIGITEFVAELSPGEASNPGFRQRLLNANSKILIK